MGRVMGCLPAVSRLFRKKQGNVLYFRYVIGTNSSFLEVIVMGPTSYDVQAIVSQARDKPLRIHNIRWNPLRSQLEHITTTKLRVALERDDEFEGAEFPLATFAQVLPLPAWSRISLACLVTCPGEITERRLDACGVHQYVRDVDVCDSKGTWLQLRIVHHEPCDLDFLQVGLHVIIKYGKTTGRGIYADITELAQVEATGKDMKVTLPELEAAQPLFSQRSLTQTDDDM